MSYIILLKYVQVKNANVLSSNYAVTPMPLMAVGAFSHLLALRSESNCTGFAVIHHNSRYNAESDIFSGFKVTGFQQFRSAMYIDNKDHTAGNSSSRLSPLSLQPVAHEALTVSLLIECSSRPDLDLIKDHMRSARIAGGDVVSYSSAEVFNSSDDALDLNIPANGFWFIDRRDLVDENDPATSLINALGSREESWILPVVPGYALTTDLESNVPGVRLLPDLEPMDHAYAEPLLGLGQYVSIRQFDGDTPFWRASWITDSIYIFQNNN